MPGNQEEITRSHFEAFHRNYSQFDYPPRKSGASHTALIAAGTFLLMLMSALAVAAWMDPALVPKGASLLRTAGAAIGLDHPAGPRNGTGAQFGISREELPYDGNAMPDTAGSMANSSTSSSGNSEMPEQDAGAGAVPGTETVPASSEAGPTRTEELAPASALVADAKPTPSVTPRPKQAAVSSAVRKKEISRLRRQAEDELFSE